MGKIDFSGLIATNIDLLAWTKNRVGAQALVTVSQDLPSVSGKTIGHLPRTYGYNSL